MVDGWCVSPLGGVKPNVPAAHGEPVRFPNDGATVKPGREAHELQETLDDETLLVILLTHKQIVRPDGAQEPVHNLADTLEMSRPVLAFENGFEAARDRSVRG